MAFYQVLEEELSTAPGTAPADRYLLGGGAAAGGSGTAPFAMSNGPSPPPPLPNVDEPFDITTLMLQRPLPVQPAAAAPPQAYTERIHSPYLLDTLVHPEEYWFAVSTDLAAAHWWFKTHCSLRARVTRDALGQWRWDGQRQKHDLPQFELPRGPTDLSHLVYYCASERSVYVHHLAFDGFHDLPLAFHWPSMTVHPSTTFHWPSTTFR